VRLGFGLEPETAAALERTSTLIREAAPARLSYELLEALRTGKAAGIVAAWRRFGLWERAFPGLPSGPEHDPLLAELDRRISGGARLPDAVVIGTLFLPGYARLLARVLGEGRRVNNPELIAGLREMLEPAAASVHVANHTVHLIHHGLFSATKLRWPPERGRQVVKLARQEHFQVAWELASVGVATGLLPGEAWQVWARSLAQFHARGEVEEPEVVVDPVARTRRRRRRGRRRR
jgi:poly(A) polymerase